MGDSKTVTEKFVSGRLLARNSILNLGGGGSLLLLSILFVPAMLRTFGMELYGVLAVTWMVLGHLRWLDLGFSAACTKFVAQDLAQGRDERAGQWAWTAVAVQTLLGLVAGAVLWAGAPMLAELLKIDPARRDLVVFALQMFALVVPIELSTRSINAVLEATQRFDWINLLAVASAVWTYSTYAVGIARGGDFHVVVYGLVSLRVASLLATAWLARKALPSFGALSTLRTQALRLGRSAREMFGFAGWVSVSAGVGPLIFFFDRWVIGSVLGVALLPLYTVPLQMLVSLQMIPASLSSTLFPAFSVLRANTQWERVQYLLIRSQRYLLLGLIPLLTVLFLWAPEILRIWIDAQFAADAALPFRILVIGFGIGLFAPISGVLLQGAGRPDVLPKVYLVEFPFNVALTLFLVRNYGIVGAALTYTIRTVAEAVVLWICIHRVFPLSGRALAGGTLRGMGPIVAGVAALGLLFPGASIHDPSAIGITVLALVAYLAAVPFYLLDASDRSFLKRLLRRAEPEVPVEGSVVG